MADEFEREIRDRLAGYLKGQERIEDVAAWLSGELAQPPAMEPETEALAYTARLLISEHARGDRSDARLADAMRGLLKTVVTVYQPEAAPPRVHAHATSGSSSLVTRWPGVAVRTQLAGAPA